jgi:hypothetical protein
VVGDAGAIPELVEALVSTDVTVRAAAEKALEASFPGWREAAAVRERLSRLAGSKAAEDRKRRADLLGKVGGADAAREMIETLERETSVPVLVAVLEALGRLGDGAAVGPLLRFFESANGYMMRQAASVLDRVEPSWRDSVRAAEMSARLESRLSTGGPRSEVVSALGLLRRRSSIGPLSALLADLDRDLRRLAGEALEAIDPRWAASEEALSELPALLAALAGSPRRRQIATEALVRLGDARAGASGLATTEDDAIPARSRTLLRAIANIALSGQTMSAGLTAAVEKLTSRAGRTLLGALAESARHPEVRSAAGRELEARRNREETWIQRREIAAPLQPALFACVAARSDRAATALAAIDLLGADAAEKVLTKIAEAASDAAVRGAAGAKVAAKKRAAEAKKKREQEECRSGRHTWVIGGWSYMTYRGSQVTPTKFHLACQYCHKRASKEEESQDDAESRARSALWDRKEAAKLAALAEIEDQAVLGAIAEFDDSISLQMAAIGRLEDQDLLATIAETKGESSVRYAAIRRLADQAVLASLAASDDDEIVRRVAIEHLKDRETLETIARSGPEAVRRAARARLGELEVQRSAS